MNMEIDNAIVGHGYIISRNPAVPADARKLQISPQSFSRLLISPRSMLPKKSSIFHWQLCENSQTSEGTQLGFPCLTDGWDPMGPNRPSSNLEGTSTPRIHGPTGKGEKIPSLKLPTNPISGFKCMAKKATCS